MAFDQIPPYADSDIDPADLMDHVDFQRRGLANVSLTNFTNSSLPSIVNGSVIEVNGTLFQAVGNIAPTGSPSDGTVYILLTPSGVSPSETLSATLTATAPTWFGSKQGWYNAGGTARYVEFKMTKSGASYTDKRQFPLKDNEDITFSAGGEIQALEVQSLGMSKFNAYMSANLAFPASGTTLVFNTERFDGIGDYDNSTGIFTCVQPGFYFFGAFIAVTDTTIFTSGVRIMRNSAAIVDSLAHAPMAGMPANSFQQASLTTIVELAVGDTIEVITAGSSGTPTIQGSSTSVMQTYFFGYKLV